MVHHHYNCVIHKLTRVFARLINYLSQNEKKGNIELVKGLWNFRGQLGLTKKKKNRMHNYCEGASDFVIYSVLNNDIHIKYLQICIHRE